MIISEENTKEIASIISICFLKFNYNKNEFELQNWVLIDVILSDVDHWSLLLNGALIKGNIAYYFAKKKL